MAELKANNQKPNFDNNPKLIEAIAEMRKNFCAETQNKVINTALACTFLVPAMVEKTTELVADAENHVNFEDKSKAKFILLNNNKTNGTFFPVFTSPEEAKKLQYDKPFQSFAMRFQDIAALTEQTPKVQGFVVNPFGENLPFTQEMLESIKQTLIKVAKERKAAREAAERMKDCDMSDVSKFHEVNQKMIAKIQKETADIKLQKISEKDIVEPDSVVDEENSEEIETRKPVRTRKRK